MASRVKPRTEGPIPKAPPKRKMDRRLRDKKYLSYLHKLECCITGETGAHLTAHHVMAGRESYGKKEDDSVCVPIVDRLHLHQHAGSLERVGERMFWNYYGVDPLALARDLRSIYERHGPNVDHGLTIIRAHRALSRVRTYIGDVHIFEPKL